jgi:hypothetical protein
MQEIPVTPSGALESRLCSRGRRSAVRIPRGFSGRGKTYLYRTVLQDRPARKQDLLVSAREEKVPPYTVVCNRERDVTTLSSHGEDSKLLDSLRIGSSRRDVRLGTMAIMVRWLEWVRLVRIGLGV